MITNKWIKIGESVKDAPVWSPGAFARYAVMEYVKSNGMREYKEVLMATWGYSGDPAIIRSQKEPIIEATHG